MTWYYVANNERKGPVEQADFDQLIQQGVITPATLVWREGMAEWQPREAVVGSVGAPPPPSGAAPGVVCSQCGRIFQPDEVIRLGSGYVCAACKPIATQKLREGVLDANSSEQIRKDHISHEASVKSIGLLYFLGGGALALLGILATFGVFSSGRAASAGFGAILVVVFFGMGALQIWVGWGIRQLKPWARIASGVLSGIGLLGFPLGTLINAYILYLLFSKKGTTIFSPDYQRVIAETPHIKYKTSIIVWILVAIVIFGCGLAMILPAITRILHR
jgi:hypothetical protein